MLRCKQSYADICPIGQLKLVGNSLVAWPSALQGCRRVPHPLRETKPFLRDKILCKASSGHVGNVQNNLAIGDYKDKHVALFRATDTVLDCGQGIIIDFPTWKALREMLVTNKPEVTLTIKMLLKLAGNAEEEVAAGLAEEVLVPPSAEAAQPPAREKRDKKEKRAKRPPPAPQPVTGGLAAAAAAAVLAAQQQGGEVQLPPPVAAVERAPAVPQAAKKQRVAKQEPEADPDAWMETELGEYPNAIRLVSSTSSDEYEQLIEETIKATAVAYDAQWAPDFEEGADNQIALLQLAFPITGNTYVLQLPMLGMGMPPEIQRLFESSGVAAVGFAANEIDTHKFEISGVDIDKGSLYDVQPWCEAEMGENESVKQGWRVGIKRGAACVLDFEMDKTSTIASSNWEREELTSAQVEYAAMDVWVALRLYQRLVEAYRT